MTDLPSLQGGGFFPYIATDLLPYGAKERLLQLKKRNSPDTSTANAHTLAQ